MRLLSLQTERQAGSFLYDSGSALPPAPVVWLRCAVSLARFFLAVVPQIAGVSCARLRSSAAIKIDHRWRGDLSDKTAAQTAARNHNGPWRASLPGSRRCFAEGRCGEPIKTG